MQSTETQHIRNGFSKISIFIFLFTTFFFHYKYIKFLYIKNKRLKALFASFFFSKQNKIVVS